MDMFFKDNDSIQQMYIISASAESVQLFSEVPNPDKFKKKGLIALKLTDGPLTTHNVNKDVVFLEMTRNILDHLFFVFNDIMSPVM